MSEPRIGTDSLFEIECFVMKQPHSPLQIYAAKLCDKVRELQHELDDPRYQYSGRINRQALLSRDARIDALKDEVKQLKATIAKLEERLKQHHLTEEIT